MTTTADGTTLHVTDSGGEGRPLVLIHGWPLSGESFARNRDALTAAGLRVVTYDRRGFGQSGKPSSGYDYDTLAADLHSVIEDLDLTDAVILGFSMGGGEVARYCANHGTDRLAGVVLSGSILPALCQSDDNPDGAMPREAFQEMSDNCRADHEGFVSDFVTAFFSNNDGLAVDEAIRDEGLQIALQSDANAAADCIMIWTDDFRADCAKIDVPALLIHGDGDQNVPLDASSRRAAEDIPDAKLVVVEGGTHGLNLSHQQQWERAVIDFVTSL